MASDFIVDENGVIIRYIGYQRNAVIPSELIYKPSFFSKGRMVRVKAVGADAFACLTNDIYVYNRHGKSKYYDYFIEKGINERCKRIESVTIPDGVKVIGERAFAGCSSLATVSLPNSLIEIGGGAFAGCSSLVTVSLPNSLIEIGERAFADCSKLASVVIPNGITEIKNHAFFRCTHLESVDIPDSVKAIGCGAFEYCKALKEVTIPSGVANIDYESFKDCTSLRAVNIQNGVKVINTCAFSGCISLESIYIPDSVQAIKQHAFGRCNGITLLGAKGGAAQIYSQKYKVSFRKDNGETHLYKSQSAEVGSMVHKYNASAIQNEASSTKPVNKRVFISYSSEDTALAEQVKKLLEDNLVSCWMARDSIKGGEDYVNKILEAIQSSSAVVFLLSENSQKSPWVKREIDTAINQGKYIIPFHIDSSVITKDFEFLLLRCQRIEALDRINEAFKELLGIVKGSIS